MPFPPTGSVVSTDLDNMLRGLNRDNSDHALTGTTVETTLASFSVSANTVGATGGLLVLAVGSSSGAGGTKTVKLNFGSANVITFTVAAGSQEWFIEAYIFNTATNAQRIFVKSGYFASGSGAPTLTYDYTSGAIDTTANQTLKTTGTLANAGDSCTNTMWDVFVIQIN